MKNTAKNTFHSCTAYILSFLCPTLLQHQSSKSKCLQNIISGGEMEEENWGESKQQMNCSQFEVGKSPFIPSLHFLLLSSSLHSGSSPLGERSEWKRWAESWSAVERHGTPGHVSTTYPSTWSCAQDAPSDMDVSSSTKKLKTGTYEVIAPPGANLFPLVMAWVCLHHQMNNPDPPNAPPSCVSVYLSLKSKCPSTRCTWTTTLKQFLLTGKGSSGQETTRAS